MIFTVHQAKTQFFKLIASALVGEAVTIARGEQAGGQADGLQPTRKGPVFGLTRGRIALTDAFFKPLPNEELALWNGGSD